MSDRPWIMRTYAGHSSAKKSNELFRKNLSRGQTGLSIAFDLPTQCGYDADHELARGEVGKVGVPVSSLADLELLLDGIPVEEANTSMTINAPAPWLLALYIALAERRGIDKSVLRGTVQNDVLKEYLARGTWIVGPEPGLRLSTDLIEYTIREMPSFSPINLCSYHLREAGATAVQEIAFTLANAIAVLDAIDVPEELMPKVVGRISFFCNAGIRFIEETCKMRVFTKLWARIAEERYGVDEPKLRRFRCGVQVNSLGLTAEQPENNLARIVLESLGVLLSRDARARALQLPAWNEAHGLPRAWDQQVSLRIQQILAYETDLLEYPDLFEGSIVINEKCAEMEAEAWAEIKALLERGGAVAGIVDGSTSAALLASSAQRMAAIASESQIVVGKNRFRECEPSPLLASEDGAIVSVDANAGDEQIRRLEAHRASRDQAAVDAALNHLREVLASDENVMPASIACAHAGVTTGEWSQAVRDVLGAWRNQTTLAAGISAGSTSSGSRERVEEVSKQVGHRLRLLLGKPGLDGHTGGAEQVALAARDAGWEVIYSGIRWTPDEIASAAMQEDVDLVGLSILSGSHMDLVPAVLDKVDVPVVVGGIIPKQDAKRLRELGISAVYTPADHDLGIIVSQMADIVAGAQEDA
jgi:(2R)-ethylmalonyl-CoA mutase